MILILLGSCLGEESRTPYPGQRLQTDSLLTATYPKLYDAIFSRDAERIKPFLDHELIEIRKQAWRSLANTPVDSVEWMIQLARDTDLQVSWFALSHQTLDQSQLRGLEQFWLSNPEKRQGVSRVLGKQGDRGSMAFLFEQLDDAAGKSYEFHFALALGRLMTRFAATAEDQQQLIRQAFVSIEPEVTRAYLYGYYRGDEQQWNQQLRDLLYQEWQLYGIGVSSEVDQYVARILGERVFRQLTLYYNAEQLLNNNIQLAVELAQVFENLKMKTDYELPARILLSHTNPHVVRLTLSALDGKLSKGDVVFGYISNSMLPSDSLEPSVWLQALETILKVEPALISKYQGRIEAIRKNHPYQLDQVLAIHRVTDSHEVFMDRLQQYMGEGDPLQSLFVIRSLSAFWNDLDRGERTDQIIERSRNILYQALQLRDRAAAFAAQPLLMDPVLAGNDFERINQALSAFRLPEDIEVYQAFGRLYRERFEEQAAPVVDSLAGLGYPPLNRALAEAGWKVEVPEDPATTFRSPRWNRLWKLGEHPVWILDTEQGPVRLELDLLTAPATVAAVDSLTRSGAYNGVPFHRVVPNFVIQGGDIERGDGFGGPDFIIPTEGSEQPFDRGALGIASAGTDTEGSQYFIMHQWKPHLNGRYTRFGRVISGMDVVDRIVQGDSVRAVYWEK